MSPEEFADEFLRQDTTDDVVVKRFDCSWINIEDIVARQVLNAMKHLGPIHPLDVYAIQLVVTRVEGSVAEYITNRDTGDEQAES